MTFLEELYKIKTIKGKKEKSEVVQMTKMLETLGAVHTHTHTHTHTSILNNEIIKFNIENKAKLIAVFGGEL